MSDTEFVAGMSMVISLGCLVAIGCLYRDFRSDNFRDQLFTLRDEMFLYVLNEGITETAAHRNLRLVMNHFIRYAHRVSVSRLLLLDLCDRVFAIRQSPPNVYVEWVEAVDALPVHQAQRLREFHDKAMFLMEKHLVSGSPPLWLTYWLGYVAGRAHILIFKSTKTFIDRVINSFTKRLEVDALLTT
jgi:hypothetical protein